MPLFEVGARSLVSVHLEELTEPYLKTVRLDDIFPEGGALETPLLAEQLRCLVAASKGQNSSKSVSARLAKAATPFFTHSACI